MGPSRDSGSLTSKSSPGGYTSTAPVRSQPGETGADLLADEGEVVGTGLGLLMVIMNWRPPMTTLPFVASLTRFTAVTGLLAMTIACAGASSQKPGDAQGTLASAVPTSTPVLLSCPAGQQPLMRQVLVNGATVPQIECVSVGAVAAPVVPAMPTGVPVGTAVGLAAAPTYAPAAPAIVYQEPAPLATRVRTTTPRPAARRVVYGDDIVEYRRPSRRTWQKSAVIIGSAAGAGAGVGALTGGKKGALIGAAIGGGAATVWDQVTRRQPR